jgi:hypothetical protein
MITNGRKSIGLPRTKRSIPIANGRRMAHANRATTCAQSRSIGEKVPGAPIASVFQNRGVAFKPTAGCRWSSGLDCVSGESL